MQNKLIYQKLEKIIPKENIKYDEEMGKHTSFKTGGKAECFVVVKKEEEILDVVQFAKKEDIKIHIIGNGSNILVKDGGVKGIVLKIDLQGYKFEKDYIVSVKSGTKIAGFAQILKQEGFSGFEELSGIPGTIGGAIRMNAGAYGKEIKDLVIETKCINKEGKIVVFSNEEQKFEYRGSIFKNQDYIILETKLQLKQGTIKEIEDKIKQYLKSRNDNQPLEYPSAGSTFKRGTGFITAKLIDEAGLKGYCIGGAQISEKHAGFIINKGNATSQDILDLIDYTKKVIYEKYNIKIEEEIEIIGE